MTNSRNYTTRYSVFRRGAKWKPARPRFRRLSSRSPSTSTVSIHILLSHKPHRKTSRVYRVMRIVILFRSRLAAARRVGRPHVITVIIIPVHNNHAVECARYTWGQWISVSALMRPPPHPRVRGCGRDATVGELRKSLNLSAPAVGGHRRRRAGLGEITLRRRRRRRRVGVRNISFSHSPRHPVSHPYARPLRVSSIWRQCLCVVVELSRCWRQNFYPGSVSAHGHYMSVAGVKPPAADHCRRRRFLLNQNHYDK